MTIERTLEIQRLKLLRLVAGWLAVVVFMSVGPFSHALSGWVGEYIRSVLSRAEAAAQRLVIAQARFISGGISSEIPCERFFECAALAAVEHTGEDSVSSLRGRLEALIAMLEDLPRHGLRLLRRTEKRVRRLGRSGRKGRTHRPPLSFDMREAPRAWRLVGSRIERPPDKRRFRLGV